MSSHNTGYPSILAVNHIQNLCENDPDFHTVYATAHIQKIPELTQANGNWRPGKEQEGLTDAHTYIGYQSTGNHSEDVQRNPGRPANKTPENPQ